MECLTASASPTKSPLKQLLLSNPHSFPPDFHPHFSFKINTSALSPAVKSPSLTQGTHERHSPSAPPSIKRRRSDAVDSLPFPLSLYKKNPHAIYEDVQRFARQNKLKEALTILDYLDHRGVPVNPTTFSSLIAACVRLKALDEGKQVHVHIRINGLQKNEFLRTKLVHMYTACGAVEDAKRLFDGMPSKTVHPWNALLRGNVISGGRQYRDSLHTFSEMRALGIELNVYSFSCMIKSFAGASALYQGLKIHSLLIKNGLVIDSLLKTSLIDMYFKCGKVKLARVVFEEIDERDIVAWGAMIAGFAHNRLQREALEYTRKMRRQGIDPNSVILTTILPAIGDVCAKKLGQEVHAYVIKTKEYSKQLFIQSSLVDMYGKCGDMSSGRKVFYASKERNAISWTALMSGYIANGRLEEALGSVVWMQQEGFKPDVVTVSTILPVCRELKSLKEGKQVHAYAVKNCFLPNISICTSLIMVYSKCGLLDYSSKLFNCMENKNVIAWTSMIESYIENGQPHEALGVFRLMNLSKHRSDSVATARMLSVCGKLGAVKLGKELHGQVLKKDLQSIPFVEAEVLRMYGVCGAIGKAKLAFDEISVKGSMTWTAIIEAFGHNGMFQEAVFLFKEMLSNGFLPNQFTFQVVLSICQQAGFADEACWTLDLMTKRFKIKASEEDYSIVTGLLTSTGRIEEAEKYVVKLKSALDV